MIMGAALLVLIPAPPAAPSPDDICVFKFRVSSVVKVALMASYLALSSALSLLLLVRRSSVGVD